MNDDASPRRRRATQRLAIALFTLSLVLAGAACDKPHDSFADPVPANPDPVAEAAKSREWSLPLVERRVRAIQSKNYDAFVRTDASFKDQQKRAASAKDPSLAGGEATAQMQDYWTAVQKRPAEKSNKTLEENIFLYKDVQWTVDPETQTIPDTAEVGGPNKQRVFVSCTFSNPAEAPSLGDPAKPVKSARVSYVVTPQGIDRATYGALRVDDDTVTYFGK